MTLPTKPGGAIDWDSLDKCIYSRLSIAYPGQHRVCMDIVQFAKLIAEHVREQAARAAYGLLEQRHSQNDTFNTGVMSGALMSASAIRKMEV